MAEFKHGLCGCFDDCGLCLITYFIPCYTFGKNAEAVGDNCVLCAIAWLFVPPCVGAMVRKKIREKQGISGSFIGDLAVHWCCALCAIVQDAQEVKEFSPGGQVVERE